MNDAISATHDFSIQRHAVQQLLRQALDAAPKPVHGLLGGRDQNVEAVLAVGDDISRDVIRDTLQAWRQNGIDLLAAYSSEQDVRPFPTGLLPDMDIADLPRLIIRTGTLGRIEARLLTARADGRMRDCPLQMQEDGGLYPLRNKG